MKRLLIAVCCIVLSLPLFAQSAAEPASREDVVLLLRTMQSHDMMQRTMEAITKQMHQMYHELYMKDKDKLPPDFESRISKMMDEMMLNMPFDDMMQAMIPVYQKHFTRNDIEALNAFYSSPVGQKFLHEAPAVTGEAMQAMMPVLTKYAQQRQERMQQEIKKMMENTPKPAGQDRPAQN